MERTVRRAKEVRDAATSRGRRARKEVGLAEREKAGGRSGSRVEEVGHGQEGDANGVDKDKSESGVRMNRDRQSGKKNKKKNAKWAKAFAEL